MRPRLEIDLERACALLTEGKSIKEVAWMLGISERTLRRRLKSKRAKEPRQNPGKTQAAPSPKVDTSPQVQAIYEASRLNPANQADLGRLNPSKALLAALARWDDFVRRRLEYQRAKGEGEGEEEAPGPQPASEKEAREVLSGLKSALGLEETALFEALSQRIGNSLADLKAHPNYPLWREIARLRGKLGWWDPRGLPPEVALIYLDLEGVDLSPWAIKTHLNQQSIQAAMLAAALPGELASARDKLQELKRLQAWLGELEVRHLLRPG